MVYRRERTDEPTQFQNRLILPMSVFDIIGSIAWAFSSTPIPRGSNCTYGALGNQATCITQGFMITLGTIVPMYNAMLCIYYLLVVKYKIRDEAIAKYEPLMHFTCICPALAVSIVAASNGLFNNFSLVCWIVERDNYKFDLNNTSDHTIRKNVHMFVAIFGALVLLTIGYCMISMCRFVKEQELMMSTYQFSRPDENDAPGNRARSSQYSRLSNPAIDTKKQAFLYIGSFVFTYSFSTVCIAFEFFGTELPFILMLLQGISAPLQGFWNFLAYTRPRWNIISRQHNDKGIMRRFYLTVFHQPEELLPGQIGRRGSSTLRMRRRHSV